MGRKRTAEEYFQTAKANDWVAGTYKEEDRVIQEKDPPSGRYKIACKVSFECLHVEYYPTVLPNPSRETLPSSYPCFVKVIL
jgi:hypothetical protein